MKLPITPLLIASLLFAGTASALLSERNAVEASDSANVELHDWIARKDANVCGISKLKRVTNPAVVDYPALMAATPQMIEMREKGIDADSIEGKTLREAARNLIVRKAQSVQKDGGYDGLWKAIRHKDGRAIDDVTQDVIALF